MAYRLLAQMRVDLYTGLEKLAPAYLLKRRSGDLVSLGTQDVETVEYFFAHVVAPAMVALADTIDGLIALAFIAWPTALVLLPFLAYAALAPVFERRKVDALGGQARAELGGLNAFVVDTVQGMGELIAFRAIAARRKVFHDQVAEYQRTRVALNADLSFQTARQETIPALGSASVLVTAAFMIHSHAFEPTLLPLVALLASAASSPYRNWHRPHDSSPTRSHRRGASMPSMSSPFRSSMVRSSCRYIRRIGAGIFERDLLLRQSRTYGA